jgi:hypothetical protein
MVRGFFHGITSRKENAMNTATRKATKKTTKASNKNHVVRAPAAYTGAPIRLGHSTDALR